MTDLSDMPDDPDPWIGFRCSVLGMELAMHDLGGALLGTVNALKHLEAAWYMEVRDDPDRW